MEVTHSGGKRGELYLGIQNYLAGPEQGNIRSVWALWSNTELPETSHAHILANGFYPGMMFL